MSAAAGLARVTISSPQRRIDVALPDAVPLAELLPEILQHAGIGLADEGEQHGGWLLRRADGTALSPATGLAGQGVRDGTVVHLVPARTRWPELEYDDVVEAIAAGARRYGLGWSPAATRVTGLVAAGVALAAALVIAGRTGAWSAALGAAAVLVAAGVLASRAYGDAMVGAVVAAYGLPFALVAGLASGYGGAEAWLLGSTALLLAGLVAAVGVGHLLRLFVAGAAAGVLGVAGGLIGLQVRPAGTAAILLALLAAGVAALPLLAIRLGRLPLPVLAAPGDPTAAPTAMSTAISPAASTAMSTAMSTAASTAALGAASTSARGAASTAARAAASTVAPGAVVAAEPAPDRPRVFAAVARTDELLTGMLLGSAAVAAVASLVLARSGDVSGRFLVGVAALAMLLRARLFVTVRHRLPLLGAGAAGLLALAFTVPWPPAWAVVALAGLGLGTALAGARFATRSPSPYVGRAADLVDVLCVISVVPLACAVLGLFGLARGLAG